jgi:hypothetical protein
VSGGAQRRSWARAAAGSDRCMLPSGGHRLSADGLPHAHCAAPPPPAAAATCTAASTAPAAAASTAAAQSPGRAATAAAPAAPVLAAATSGVSGARGEGAGLQQRPPTSAPQARARRRSRVAPLMAAPAGGYGGGRPGGRGPGFSGYEDRGSYGGGAGGCAAQPRRPGRADRGIGQPAALQEAPKVIAGS